MATTELKTPLCNTSSCFNIAECSKAGSCQYKSSADEWREARESLDVVVNAQAAIIDSVGGIIPLAKPSNPKDIIGSNKLPLHLFPLSAIAQGCLAFLEGALKYGRSNFRVVGVRSSIYYDACRRHIDSWFEGEDIDPDSGLPHLAKALACIAVLIDAHTAGKLNDDRMIEGGYANLVNTLTLKVAELKTRHADKTPQHYTIADNTP